MISKFLIFFSLINIALAQYCPNNQDIDYPGNDVGSVLESNPVNCCSHCNEDPKCSVYSWSNSNGGTCWLKNSIATAVVKPGVISGIAKYDFSKCEQKSEVDYLGNDIGNVANIPSYKLCCDICLGTEDCRQVTWTNFNGGTCWLKNGSIYYFD